MSDLFVRTLSQGLQGLLPVAFALAVARRHRKATAIAGIRWGLVAAIPATVLAGSLLQRTAHQSAWEAFLAITAAIIVAWSIGALDRRLSRAWVAAATVLIVVRQTMEIDASFVVAALELHSRDATMTVCSAAFVACGLAAGWVWLARRLPPRAFDRATTWFIVLYSAQLALYAFHESAEARLLPWSEALHAATEPYGPDGIYGRYFSWLLIAAPLLRAAIASVRAQEGRTAVFAPRAWRMAAAACLVMIGVSSGDEPHPAAARGGPPPDVSSISNQPHILFRHTGVDANYGRLSVASLEQPDGRRLEVGAPCERVAFGAGRGICLQAARGVFTTYKAVLFDRQFKPLSSFTLAGPPSRTRVAADGRVGAFTVFVTGHGYGGSSFSTKTTLVDMASGDILGDLEQFATWRDGVRVRAKDFNFWGVTFGRDSNMFYATLGTAGTTYLVQGDLALRKMTVVRPDVECPSLSPDGRLIAFKKRLGSPGVWRLYVLDLATMTERPIASEARSVDDQIEWLDNAHVLYAVPHEGSAVTDVWMAPVDGNSRSTMFMPAAESPAVVR